MRITGDGPKVFGVYSKPNQVGKADKNAAVAGTKKDEITISAPAKDFQTVMKALRKLPDIREDKVKEISFKIQKGDYKVEPKDISERIIKDLSARKI